MVRIYSNSLSINRRPFFFSFLGEGKYFKYLFDIYKVFTIFELSLR